MSPRHCLEHAVDPALRWLIEHEVPFTPSARMFLVAVAMQECGLMHRAQQPWGPGRGLWQFEPNGARGVLRHERTSQVADAICREALVTPNVTGVMYAIEHNDQLAAAFARLLLWTDPHSVPLNEPDGWRTYLRLWRPGKPRADQWRASWALAQSAVASWPWRHFEIQSPDPIGIA